MHIILSSLRDFSLPEAYKQISGTDILARIDPLVDRTSLKPMVSSLFRNDTVKGGRPNVDEVTMIRTLFIQKLYGLADEATEKELYDRISFRHFLQYPEKMPDARTIWLSGKGYRHRAWT